MSGREIGGLGDARVGSLQRVILGDMNCWPELNIRATPGPCVHLGHPRLSLHCPNTILEETVGSTHSTLESWDSGDLTAYLGSLPKYGGSDLSSPWPPWLLTCHKGQSSHRSAT
jgi:hypothetical protein